ncbi:glycosyltransferase [Accumulibacter sp.]|jgi:glycosyltransferase involved in cell wall biosynthesis|uniref:glycosyltransferase n=1 Tax=Accumulibacter sp. TaxID=2053492 RepID=UPI001AD44956|nr:glycosyltransferase [Accumulibacter sp.]MBN8453810.1 glycosyltransferase [Accumulibacter sp.]MBO3706496.1 glycosyltransferase [Candidatus Accumulibacter conexus]
MKVLIIGFGVAEAHGDGFKTKSAISNYLATWNESCDVTWACEVLQTDRGFDGKVDRDIKVLQLTKNMLSNYIALNRSVLESSDGEHAKYDVVIAAYPAAILAGLCLLRRGFSDVLAIYVGNDFTLPLKQKWGLRRFRNAAGAYWRLAWMGALFRASTFIIARGAHLRTKLERYRRPVHETVAITQISSGTLEGYPVVNLPDKYSLFVGNLSSEKGVDILVEGHRLARSVDSATPDLVLVGSGPLEEEIRTSEPDGLRLLGYVDNEHQLSHLYTKALRLVVPSRPWGEGVPRVIEEAIARGTVVWCSPLETVVREFGTSLRYFSSAPPAVEDMAKVLVGADDNGHNTGPPTRRLIGAREAARQHIDLSVTAMTRQNREPAR